MGINFNNSRRRARRRWALSAISALIRIKWSKILQLLHGVTFSKGRSSLAKINGDGRAGGNACGHPLRPPMERMCVPAFHTHSPPAAYKIPPHTPPGKTAPSLISTWGAGGQSSLSNKLLYSTLLYSFASSAPPLSPPVIKNSVCIFSSTGEEGWAFCGCQIQLKSISI